MPETILHLLRFGNLVSKAQKDNKTENNLFPKQEYDKLWKNLMFFWVVIRWFCRNCNHILLLGAKIELSRVGKLSLAEHLLGARATLVSG